MASAKLVYLLLSPITLEHLAQVSRRHAGWYDVIMSDKYEQQWHV